MSFKSRVITRGEELLSFSAGDPLGCFDPSNVTSPIPNDVSRVLASRRDSSGGTSTI